MNETRLKPLGKTLALAAVVEIGTGLALINDPASVVALLLGKNELDQGILLGRFFGVALLALGLSCWPNRQRAETGSQAFYGMLTYNLLIALFLAYVGTVGPPGGALLWPAVVLHGAIALLLVWTWRTEWRGGATNAA